MKTLRSELKIRFSFSSVCVHELAAVAAATAATTSLPYRHRHRRYHHHQHHTAHKSTTAGLLTTAGGVSGYATQSVADSTLLLLTRCILQFSIHLALPSTENFSRGLPDAKNTQLVCSEEYTASKLVLFCLYIPKSDYSSVGTAYSTVSFVIHIFIQILFKQLLLLLLQLLPLQLPGPTRTPTLQQRQQRPRRLPLNSVID